MLLGAPPIMEVSTHGQAQAICEKIIEALCDSGTARQDRHTSFAFAVDE